MTLKYPHYFAVLSILLTTLFVALRMVGFINWSWGLVISPSWIYVCLLVLEKVYWWIVAWFYQIAYNAAMDAIKGDEEEEEKE